MQICFQIETIDNGLIVNAGPTANASDPLAQRGPRPSRVYCEDPTAAAAHIEGILTTALAAAESRAAR